MTGLLEWWARNHIAANLLMVACIIAGIAAFFQLDRELNPAASFSGADISVTWPGASPQEVEEQIILRIEEAIAGIDGIKHIDSTAKEGLAFIDIEGEEPLDITRFITEIENQVNAIPTLPNDAYRPIVSQSRDQTRGFFMAVYGSLSEQELNRLARKLRRELASLTDGSPLVDSWGARKEEISIEVSEETLRRYGLRFDDVVQAVRGSSLNLAGGQVRTDNGNVQIAARALADSEADFNRIIVRQLPDGGILRLGDIANVVDGFEDQNLVRTVNGEPSITLAVRMPENSNLTTISKAVNQWVDEKNEELEGRASIFIWFDGAEPFNSQLGLVASNALIGLVLVLVILMLFLSPAVAFWVAVGIAISFAGAFIFMPASGISLNFLSIFGFLLVIGIVVDDAIIVGESIHNQVEKGVRGIEASVLGAQLVLKPVFFAVLTTIIAFSPWLFIGGDASQFTRQISLTITFALIFSLIEAFLILPAHLSHLKKTNKSGRFYAVQKRFSQGIINVAQQVYKPLIKTALRYRYFTVAGFFAAFAISVALLQQGWVAFKFMPEVQGTFVSMTVRLPEGAPYSRSLEIYDDVSKAANELKADLGRVGDEDYIRSVYVSAQENQVVSYLTIVDAKDRKESTKQVAEMFREKLGPILDAEEVSVGYTQNERGQVDLAYGVLADELEDLAIASAEIKNYLRTLEGVYDVRDSLQSATPELQIELKPSAERFGLTLAEVSRQIRQAFYGEEVQRLPRDGEDVRVMVRYPKAARESLNSIETMRIRTNDGREVPLTTVADARFAPSYKQIDRRDRQRSALVTAKLRGDADRAAIMQGFRTQFAPEWRQRNPTAELAERGDAQEQKEFIGDFIILYSMALFAMYMLLAIAFGSYWQPVLIMTAIPFGFMGAAFGHMVFGINFALFSFFGVGAAAGVVVNDNLVLIDYVNRLRAQGEGAFNALVEAGVNRFRPIILTSLTTFIGLLPIMFERSTDAQFLKPTIVSLSFGVFFAMFVTLIFVPTMYAVGADIARFYRWAWTGERQPEVGHGAASGASDEPSQAEASGGQAYQGS